MLGLKEQLSMIKSVQMYWQSESRFKALLGRFYPTDKDRKLSEEEVNLIRIR